MAELMYKGMLGWSAADEKHPGTHKLMTNEEYWQLVEERDQARREKAETERKAADAIKRAQLIAKREIEECEENTQALIDEKNEELAAANAEVEFQKNLNANLLRISRERANADRKLKPKKEHSGYVVISSQEKEIRYKVGKKMYAAVVWETVLQSPYNIEYTEDQARKMIFEELLTNEGGWKLGEIGITSRYLADYAELVESMGDSVKSQNRAFNQRLRANYKAGYWEYIVQHTLPVKHVPKDMLP